MNDLNISDISQIVNNVCGKHDFFGIEMIYLFFGAILAIGGGAVVEIIRVKIERESERKDVEMSLSDELDEIVKTIDKLEETHRQTGIVHKTYMDDLNRGMGAYSNCKSRIFLFKDSKFRKKIIKFYKDLREYIKRSGDNIGSLGDSAETKNKQKEIKDGFLNFRKEANEILTFFVKKNKKD